MKTRATLMNGIATLLFLAPVALQGCAAPTEPAEPEGSVGEATQAQDTNDTFVGLFPGCTSHLAFQVNTGFFNNPSSPAEPGACSDGFFTLNPASGDPDATDGTDIWDLSEAGEICALNGQSGTFVKYFSDPAQGCTDYPATFSRRWTSYVGCCDAGQAPPATNLPLTRTNKDCEGQPAASPTAQRFGTVSIGVNSTGTLVANVRVQGATANATYNVRVIQTPNSNDPNSGECSVVSGTLTTNSAGNSGTVQFTEPVQLGSHDAFVVLNNQLNSSDFLTSDEITF